MYKLNFFVPVEAKESVKKALFAIGVGKYENYEECCFETLGIGQFKPTADAKPFIGEANKLEKVNEYKVEMLCKDELIHEALEVLKDVHPYEEVAYEVFRIEDF
jgi:hypothetical protein